MNNSAQPKKMAPVLLVNVYNVNGELITHNIFYKLFSQYGKVLRVLIFEKAKIWKSFVEMSTVQEAQYAKNMLHETQIFEDGSRIHVFYSSLQTIKLQNNNTGGVDYTVLNQENIKQIKCSSKGSISSSIYNQNSIFTPPRNQSNQSQQNNPILPICTNKTINNSTLFQNNYQNTNYSIQTNYEEQEANSILDLSQLENNQKNRQKSNTVHTFQTDQVKAQNFETNKHRTYYDRYKDAETADYQVNVMSMLKNIGLDDNDEPDHEQQINVSKYQSLMNQKLDNGINYLDQFLQERDDESKLKNKNMTLNSSSYVPNSSSYVPNSFPLSTGTSNNNSNYSNSFPISTGTSNNNSNSSNSNSIHEYSQENIQILEDDQELNCNNNNSAINTNNDPFNNYVNPLFLIENLQSKVIFVKQLKNVFINNQMLQNLFGNFGNVVQIMILKKKKSALIEFQNIQQATQAKDYLNKKVFFGEEMKIFFSNFSSIELRNNHSADNKNEELLINSPENHRYDKVNPRVLNPPSTTLHISNYDKNLLNQQFLYNIFSQYGKIVAFENIELDQSKYNNNKGMCLIKYSSLNESFIAMSILHGRVLARKKIKISFTRSIVNEKLN